MLVSHVGRVGRIAAQRWGTLSHVTGQTARLSAPELVLLSDRLLWRGEGCSQYSSDGANEEEKEDKRQNARRNDNFESSGSFRTLDDTDKVLEKLAGVTETMKVTRENPYWWLGPLFDLYLHMKSAMVGRVMKRVETEFDDTEFLEGALDACYMVLKVVGEKDYAELRKMAAPLVARAFQQTQEKYGKYGLRFTADVQPDVAAYLDTWSVLPPQYVKYFTGGESREPRETEEASGEPESAASGHGEATWQEKEPDLSLRKLLGEAMERAKTGEPFRDHWLALRVRYTGTVIVRVVNEAGTVVQETLDCRPFTWTFLTGPVPKDFCPYINPVRTLNSPWILGLIQ